MRNLKLRLNNWMNTTDNKKFVAQLSSTKTNFAKNVVSELYKGKNPASVLTYIPKINLISLAKDPGAYLKKKARIVERIVTWRAKQAVLRMADEIINGSPSYKLKPNPSLQIRQDNIRELVNANSLNIKTEVLALDGQSPIQQFVKLEAEVNGETYRFFDGHATIRIAEKKNILLTKVHGRDLTRKEYISGGDYEITISGKIASVYQDVYPTREVMDLLQILRKDDIVRCESPFLEIFGINTMLVLSYDIPQQIGYSNVQNYSIQAVFEGDIKALMEIEERRKQTLSAKEIMQNEIEKRNEWLNANKEQVVSKASLKDYLKKFNPKQFIQLQSWI